MQTCIICNEEKPLSEFHKSDCHANGLDKRCKTCKNAKNREYRRRKSMGLVQERQNIKRASDVHIEPLDPDLEEKRRIRRWVKQFGKEGAVAKIRLEAFRT